MSNNTSPRDPSPQDPELHARAVRRACLPEIMTADDVRDALDLEPTADVGALIRDGFVGPYVTHGGRIYVLREAMLAHLASISVIVGPGGVRGPAGSPKGQRPAT